MTDYTKMSGPELLAALRDDGQKWAVAFNQCAVKCGYSEMDVDWLTTWFANAIEHSTDVRTGSGPVVMDDGSAFFVA